MRKQYRTIRDQYSSVEKQNREHLETIGNLRMESVQNVQIVSKLGMEVNSIKSQNTTNIDIHKTEREKWTAERAKFYTERAELENKVQDLNRDAREKDDNLKALEESIKVLNADVDRAIGIARRLENTFKRTSW